MSPTTQTLLIGFALLAVLIGAGRLIGQATGITKAIKLFFPLWFVYCAWHMSIGMGHGYSFLSELPLLLINFGVPAMVAWFVLKKWGR
ncbi:MAG: hypothetical protein H6R05_157 [Burkholderiaceae bacterium]|nr:hypothetical protein [Burkholderiaceae bacterium]